VLPDLPVLEASFSITISLVTTVAADILTEKINSIFAREIEKIVGRIQWIDMRLASLGDSEEDQVERILLSALRRHLIDDLRELGGFSGDPYLFDLPAGPETVTATGVSSEEALSYS